MRVEARAGPLISNLSGVGLQPFVVLSLSTHLRRFAGPTRPQNRRGLRFDLLRSESDDAPCSIRDPQV